MMAGGSAPLVGIAVDFVIDRGRTKYTVLERYPAAVREAGGEPLILPPDVSSVERQLDLVDGVILPGGDDLDPALWGGDAPAHYEASDARRTAYETLMAKACVARDVPLLGICLGLQLLNVALGGSLRSDFDASVAHGGVTPESTVRHAVEVDGGSRLAAALALPASGGSVDVTSQHRWAPERLGAGLRVAARAKDGVVEAAELPDKRFCLGVQWHPEASAPADGPAHQLFVSFVTACREHAAARRGLRA